MPFMSLTQTQPTPSDSHGPIRFKPLSEGLGFHHSQPEEPPIPLSGAKPFETPALRTQIPSRPQQLEPAKLHSSSHSSVHSPSVNRPTPAIRTPFQGPQAVLSAQSTGPAYRTIRSFAYVLDFIFHTALALSAIWLSLKIVQLPIANLKPIWNHREVRWLSFGFLFFFHWSLTTLQEMLFKTTLFKRIFGLALPASGERIFLRSLYFLPSFAFFGLGLIWSFFDSDKKCWHDLLVDVQPKKV